MSAVLLSDKLKASLLQAAIQGKLTKQLPEDGDTRDLLKQIEEEKERLITEKVIKKEKPLPPITADEIPFDIPDNWVWARLGDLCLKISDGSHNPPKDSGKGFPIISAKNIKNKTVNFALSDRYVSKEDFIQEDKRTSIRRGDVLLTIVGSIGESCVVETEKLFVAQRSVCVIKTLINPYYLMNIFFSPLFITFTFQKASGTAQKGIYLNTIKQFLTPIPPLKEQHRIVEALETALTKIDKLKADETKLYEIQKAFPRKLKASLLQSAIQGKLTTQLPEDGDARDLLKQIEREKERLIKEKVIKKEKPLPPITADEIPFDIPDNWVWVRLGNLCLKIGSGSTPTGGKAVYLDEGIKFIRSQNVHNDGLHLNNIVFINSNTHIAKKGSTVYPKDLLLNITGGSIGRCCIVPDSFDTANINQHILILRLFNDAMRYYLHQVIISPFTFNSIMKLQVGGTKEGLSAFSAKHLLIPLPPLAEQHRIVEALETALGKIDTLTRVTE